MKLVKAPMRISYIGGGTDYPNYFNVSPGGVIAAAINQFVYVYSHPLSNISDENFRFTYRLAESVSHYSDLKHPVLREMLIFLKWNSRDNFGTFSDLPSGTGLGGSSAFTVALSHILLKSSERPHSAKYLADLAVNVERRLLQEPGGFQDQYVSAFGDIRAYDFTSRGVEISDSLLKPESIKYLNQRQMLVWVGESRESNIYASVTHESILKNRDYFEETYKIYLETKVKLQLNQGSAASDFQVISEAVQRGWNLKQKFTASVDSRVQLIISIAQTIGIDSFKLCGAGGTGFVLILAEPEELLLLRTKLDSYAVIFPQIATVGCEVIFEE
jgi:D-glycero-alpha-D-manno-heptose-7-phosphate kinase